MKEALDGPLSSIQRSERARDCCRARIDAKLLVDVLEVFSHGVWRDDQERRDLLVRLPARYPTEDLRLAVREPVDLFRLWNVRVESFVQRDEEGSQELMHVSVPVCEVAALVAPAHGVEARDPGGRRHPEADLMLDPERS